MSVMLATDVTVLDTVIMRVVQAGDSVHRTGTEEPLEVFQGLVEDDPFMAVINGQERTMAEYGLTVSIMCVCTCVFTWADGKADHYQDPKACDRAPYDHW